MDTVLIIKIISALIYPIGMVLMLCVCGLLLWALKRIRLAAIFGVLALFILLIFSNLKVARFLAKPLEQQYAPLAIEQILRHDAILVLGGGLRLPLPPAQSAQLTAGSERYWYGARLYKAGKAQKILLLGGNIYRQPGYRGEAFYAAKLLQQWGVPESAIIIEEASRTTAQNRLNAQALLTQHKIASAILVTSALHMSRSFAEFSRLSTEESIQLTPAPTDFMVLQSTTPEIIQWLPSAAALQLSTVALHEYYGRWFLQLKALISQDS